MGTFFRFFIAIPIAIVVTILLFLGIYNQLSANPFLYKSEDDPNIVYFGLEDLFPPVIICDCGWVRVPEKPVPSNSWTESEKAAQEPPKQTPPTPSVEIDIPLYAGKKPGAGVGRMGHPHNMAYPQGCIEKSVEGVVTVQYDVTPEGHLRNAKIINSPDECFHDAIMSHISRWRYQPPKDDDGNPTWRRGEIITFTFMLNED